MEGPAELSLTSEACPTEGSADGPAELSQACPTEGPAHGPAGGPASTDRRIRPTHRVYNIQPRENTSCTEKGRANNYDGSGLPVVLADFLFSFQV